mmetsp:Transcript_77441/g.206790  ORF Transcript_77441/g.206790 Transcript_77441/m.206790 type:complete len:748 (-) Transcript_77441:129-2372(-)
MSCRGCGNSTWFCFFFFGLDLCLSSSVVPSMRIFGAASALVGGVSFDSVLGEGGVRRTGLALGGSQWSWLSTASGDRVYDSYSSELPRGSTAGGVLFDAAGVSYSYPARAEVGLWSQERGARTLSPGVSTSRRRAVAEPGLPFTGQPGVAADVEVVDADGGLIVSGSGISVSTSITTAAEKDELLSSLDVDELTLREAIMIGGVTLPQGAVLVGVNEPDTNHEDYPRELIRDRSEFADRTNTQLLAAARDMVVPGLHQLWTSRYFVLFQVNICEFTRTTSSATDFLCRDGVQSNDCSIHQGIAQCPSNMVMCEGGAGDCLGGFCCKADCANHGGDRVCDAGVNRATLWDFDGSLLHSWTYANPVKAVAVHAATGLVAIATTPAIRPNGQFDADRVEIRRASSTGELVQEFSVATTSGVRALKFSPDGKVIVFALGDVVEMHAILSTSCLIHSADGCQDANLKALSAGRYWGTCADALTALGGGAAGCEADVGALDDAFTGQPLKFVCPEACAAQPPFDGGRVGRVSEGNVCEMIFTSDGALFASAAGGVVRIHDAQSLVAQRGITLPELHEFDRQSLNVGCPAIAFSADSSLLFVTTRISTRDGVSSRSEAFAVSDGSHQFVLAGAAGVTGRPSAALGTTQGLVTLTADGYVTRWYTDVARDVLAQANVAGEAVPPAEQAGLGVWRKATFIRPSATEYTAQPLDTVDGCKDLCDSEAKCQLFAFRMNSATKDCRLYQSAGVLQPPTD